MTLQEAIERVRDWIDNEPECKPPFGEIHLVLAAAEAGARELPREPTEAMIDAGYTASSNLDEDDPAEEWVPRIWHAMYDAARAAIKETT